MAKNRRYRKQEKPEPSLTDKLQDECTDYAVRRMAKELKQCATPNQSRQILSLKKQDLVRIFTSAQAAYVVKWSELAAEHGCPIDDLLKSTYVDQGFLA